MWAAGKTLSLAPPHERDPFPGSFSVAAPQRLDARDLLVAEPEVTAAEHARHLLRRGAWPAAQNAVSRCRCSRAGSQIEQPGPSIVQAGGFMHDSSHVPIHSVGLHQVSAHELHEAFQVTGQQ